MTTRVFLVVTDHDERTAETAVHAALTSEAEAERYAAHLNGIWERAITDYAEARVVEVPLHDSAAAAFGLLPKPQTGGSGA